VKMTTAETARENYLFRLKNTLKLINSGRERDDYFYDVALYHRLIGELKLLMDADQQGFIDGLCKSAYSRLYFLRQFAAKNTVDAPYLCLSKDIALTAGLAAGHIELTKQIAKLSKDKHDPKIEYEDDFLFVRFIADSVLDGTTTEQLQKLVARWEVVLEGGASTEFAVCKTIADNDAEAFHDAFDSLIASRQQQLKQWRESTAFDEQMYSAEGFLYVKGMCVLRIAHLRGIPVKLEYPLIPRMALDIPGVSFPAQDSWRTE